jgi:hypothetical protein
MYFYSLVLNLGGREYLGFEAYFMVGVYYKLDILKTRFFTAKKYDMESLSFLNYLVNAHKIECVMQTKALSAVH